MSVFQFHVFFFIDVPAPLSLSAPNVFVPCVELCGPPLAPLPPPLPLKIVWGAHRRFCPPFPPSPFSLPQQRQLQQRHPHVQPVLGLPKVGGPRVGVDGGVDLVDAGEGVHND